MIVAVTGATGYAGRFILPRLLAEGLEIRAWRRPGSDPAGLCEAVRWIDGDLLSPPSLADLVDGADALVHAALDHIPGKYRGGEGSDLGRFITANVGGSLALLERARRSGVKRCVFLSSRAVFGARPRPSPIADDEALTPDTHYGAAKASLEAFVQSWGRGEGWAVAALRPTGIYGVIEPARRSKWFELVAAAAAGRAVEPGRAASEVHGRDVAEAVWLLLSAAPERVAGRSFNTSDIVVSPRDIMQVVQSVTGRTGPLPSEPPPAGNIMSCAGLESLGMRFGGRALFEETVAELVEAVRRT